MKAWAPRLDWHGVALIFAYAIGYLVLRPLSVDQWYLPAGLRVAALLAIPYRRWPYLIAGEFAALMWLRVPRIDEVGVPFVVLSSITIMPVVALTIRQIDKRLPERGIRSLAIISVVVPALTTAINSFLTFALMPKVPATEWTDSLTVMLGATLGILTLGPAIVAWRSPGKFLRSPKQFRQDVLLSICVTGALIVSAVSLQGISTEQLNVVRVLLILPAVAMTFLHGMHGAMFGVVAANIAIALTLQRTTTPGTMDPSALASQAILAAVAIALLESGAAISRIAFRASASKDAEQQAMDIARGSFASTERELQRRVGHLRDLGDTVHLAFKRSVQLLRDNGQHSLAMELQSAGVQHVRLIREQLSLVYPAEVQKFGLFNALHAGEMASSWGAYSTVNHHLRGNDRTLSLDLQLMTYRVVCDILAVLVATGHEQISIRAKAAEANGRRGVYIRISVPGGVFRPALAGIENMDVTGRVMVSGGRLRRGDGRIGLLMHEAVTAWDHSAAEGTMAQETTPSEVSATTSNVAER